jgi:hypothetical protein
MSSAIRHVDRVRLKSAGPVLALWLCWAPAPVAADDLVLRWNDIAARTANATNPFLQARHGTVVQLAVFEAANAITGEYESYLASPPVAAEGASIEAAVVTAAHHVLRSYFAAAAAALDAARDADLAAIPEGQAKSDGIAVGLAAASAMIALRASDGALPLTTLVPTSTAPGDYRLTTGCAAGVFYNWKDVTPFAIASPWEYLLPPPPHLGSNTYRKDYQEAATMGAHSSALRPEERSEVARLYAASSPTFLLSMATRQVAAGRSASLTENARALALVHMAINDALVASMTNKYHYNHWRPETGIRNGDLDGDARTVQDAAFLPFIGTPCFPSYPSNHASGSVAGLEAMRRLFGAAGHDITLTNTVPALGALPAATISRKYSQLDAIADDVDDARVLGGIHWRYDQVAGNALGRAVATEVVKNRLRAVHP